MGILLVLCSISSRHPVFSIHSLYNMAMLHFSEGGITLATVIGPGTVYLQSLPFSRLADRISAAAFRPQRGEKSGLGGDVLGGILGGDRSY